MASHPPVLAYAAPETRRRDRFRFHFLLAALPGAAAMFLPMLAGRGLVSGILREASNQSVRSPTDAAALWIALFLLLLPLFAAVYRSLRLKDEPSRPLAAIALCLGSLGVVAMLGMAAAMTMIAKTGVALPVTGMILLLLVPTLLFLNRRRIPVAPAAAVLLTTNSAALYLILSLAIGADFTSLTLPMLVSFVAGIGEVAYLLHIYLTAPLVCADRA